MRLSKAGRAILVGSIVAGLTSSCATNPATGRRQIALISEAEEIAMGRQADEEISASMGLYEDPELQQYVQELGSRIAAQSERPDLPWTFRVIDDPVVNAFALPGGFIYVTRGILAHLNSEAELVTVLGHEIGHVTARHSVSRLSKAQLLSVGLGVGAVLSPEIQRFGDLAEMGLGLLFLKYSRDDERQADDLGLRYTLRGGYDAREMPAVFTILKRVGETSEGGRVPNWLATHPDPVDRRQVIEARLASMDYDFGGARIERRSYLGRLDGLVFGDDPREGFFEGGAFLHPQLEFRLDFPEGWETRNQRQSVEAASPGDDAAMELRLASADDPEAAAREFLEQQGISGGRVQRRRVHGLPAATARFEAAVQQTQIAGRVVFVRYEKSTYRLLGYAKAARWDSYAKTLEDSLFSFRRLRDRRALNVQPARVKVVQPGRSQTLSEFYRQFPSTVPIEQIALINHVEPDGELTGGLEAKQVVGGRSG